MTPDEHQMARMRAWITFRISQFNGYGLSAHDADERLAEFDNRFPAPAAVEPVPAEPPMLFARTLAAMEERDAAAELAALREKARLFDKLCEELPPGWKQNLRYWDAVASGKFILEWSAVTDHDIGWSVTFHILSAQKTLQFFPTAAEAVQAAIGAGALK